MRSYLEGKVGSRPLMAVGNLNCSKTAKVSPEISFGMSSVFVNKIRRVEPFLYVSGGRFRKFF
jgi:hypothetical protein